MPYLTVNSSAKGFKGPKPGSLVVCAGTVTCKKVSEMGLGFNVFNKIFAKDEQWRDKLQVHLDNYFNNDKLKPMPAYVQIAAVDSLVGGVATVPDLNSQSYPRPLSEQRSDSQYKEAVIGAVRDAKALQRPLYIQPLGIGGYGWPPIQAAILFAAVLKEEDPAGNLDVTIPIYNQTPGKPDKLFEAELNKLMGFSKVDDVLLAGAAKIIPSSSAHITTFDSYIAQEQNDSLQTAALNVSLMLHEAPHAKDVKVIVGPVTLTALEPGYYMRFIPYQHTFHLYGIEVKAGGNVVVHENIPENAFKQKTHADNDLAAQLYALYDKGLVKFRTISGNRGVDLHADLAAHYAQTGSVADYKNSALFNGPFSKTAIASVAPFSATKSLNGLMLEFDKWLGELQLKTTELQEKGYSNYKYIDVAEAAGHLQQSLEIARRNFVPPHTTATDFTTFKTSCESAIKNAGSEFKNHRSSWGQLNPIVKGFLGVLALLTVLPAFIVAVASTHGYRETFFGDPPTDAAKKLQVFKDVVSGIKDDPANKGLLDDIEKASKPRK